MEKFRDWFADVPQLKLLRFHRHIPGTLEKVAIFGDASVKGIGAVAYLIKVQPDGSRKTQLFYSKSALMPKDLRKKDFTKDLLTIARAELIALVCCVNMSTYIQEALGAQISPEKIHIFTDSLLNLQRLQRGKGQCPVFEERRLCQILDNFEVERVHFCPGIQNPADLPSRGCKMGELLERLPFWKEGPSFLTEDIKDWPVQPVKAGEAKQPKGGNFSREANLLTLQLAQLDRERASTVCAVSQGKEELPHPIDVLLEKVSSLRTIRRIITVFRRAQRRKRGEDALPTNIRMTSSEEILAEREISRRMQEISFGKEREIASDNSDRFKTFQKGSPLLHLPVIWDSQRDLLRLHSRLHPSRTTEYDFVNPIILPKCDYARRLAVEVHQKLHHASQKQTFEKLRLTHWVQGGYNYIKDAVRKGCKTPRCRYIRFETPKMSPLPPIRMDSPEAWAHVGVDYFGPMHVLSDCTRTHYEVEGETTSRKQKVWGALFACMHTRAIFVKLVPDCSTEEFLKAFRELVAQKGRPLRFFSDNARTFKGADRQLRELLNTRMLQEIENHTYNGLGTIEWEYSTETAPWTNGCTERLIGIFKKQLIIALQKRLAKFSDVQLLCNEIVSAVNDRPLGTITATDADFMVTPSMLVSGKSPRTLETPALHTMPESTIEQMWIDRKSTILKFWQQWQKEYLASLSIDHKWAKGLTPCIKPGDVVILKPETQEKNQWKLARVIDTKLNKDGAIATVTVQVPNKAVYTRSIRQIALLEPSAEKLDRAVMGPPSSVTPTDRVRKCDIELMETDSQPAGAPAQGTEEPRSVELTRPGGSAERGNEETQDHVQTTTTDPDPELAVNQSEQGNAPTHGKRKTRGRQRPGFYRRLHEGEPSQS